MLDQIGPVIYVAVLAGLLVVVGVLLGRKERNPEKQ